MVKTYGSLASLLVGLLGLLALLALAPVRIAAAQPSGAQAETLFRQGKDLLAKGQIAEACAAFDASQKLEPAISTLLNQAACREKNNQLATAWGLFLEAERQTRSATEGPNLQHHATAATKAAKLEPRLSTLTIAVPPEARVAGLEVLRGGEPVDPGAWNKALPVDGGSYQVSARAPGNAEWSSTVTVGNDHDVKTIEIPKLKAAALDAHRALDASAQPPAGVREPAAPPPRSKRIPLIVGAGAVALAGTALGFELWARSTDSKIADEKTSNDRRISLWHSANTKRYAAEGLGVASLACAGVAVWLYVRAGHETAPAAQASRVQLVPTVAGDGAGLLVFGRY